MPDQARSFRKFIVLAVLLAIFFLLSQLLSKAPG